MHELIFAVHITKRKSVLSLKHSTIFENMKFHNISQRNNKFSLFSKSVACTKSRTPGQFPRLPALVFLM